MRVEQKAWLPPKTRSVGRTSSPRSHSASSIDAISAGPRWSPGDTFFTPAAKKISHSTQSARFSSSKSPESRFQKSLGSRLAPRRAFTVPSERWVLQIASQTAVWDISAKRSWSS